MYIYYIYTHMYKSLTYSTYQRSVAHVKDGTYTGQIMVHINYNGLHVLDIMVYSSTVALHFQCWELKVYVMYIYRRKTHLYLH